MKAYKFLAFAAVAVLSILPTVVMAAGPGFGGGVDDGGGACVPIDGGLSMLVVAGVGYGAKLVAANKKKKQGTQEADQSK